MATAMDGTMAMVVDGAMATQRQRRWTGRWRRDGDRRHDGNATAATAMAMEGAMAMGGAMVTATATVAMDGMMATVMEGTTEMRRRQRR